MRARARLAVVGVLVAVAVAACGGGAHHPAPTYQSVRACIRTHRMRVLGGPVGTSARGHSGAIAELIARNAFIVFYPSLRSARQHAAVVQANATRLKGSSVRRGTVTILFVGIDLAPGPRQVILNCS